MKEYCFDISAQNNHKFPIQKSASSFCTYYACTFIYAYLCIYMCICIPYIRSDKISEWIGRAHNSAKGIENKEYDLQRKICHLIEINR